MTNYIQVPLHRRLFRFQIQPLLYNKLNRILIITRPKLLLQTNEPSHQPQMNRCLPGETTNNLEGRQDCNTGPYHDRCG